MMERSVSFPRSVLVDVTLDVGKANLARVGRSESKAFYEQHPLMATLDNPSGASLAGAYKFKKR